jgi:peptide-methionine (R)-S-oxide reductase
MHKKIIFTIVIVSFISLLNSMAQSKKMEYQGFKISKTDDEWKKVLSSEKYHVLREKGTEIAFTGKYWNNQKEGIYYCAGCNSPLFKSDNKFKSGSGWPSFWDPISEKSIKIIIDS